jgi:hypothetical protein
VVSGASVVSAVALAFVGVIMALLAFELSPRWAVVLRVLAILHCLPVLLMLWTTAIL